MVNSTEHLGRTTESGVSAAAMAAAAAAAAEVGGPTSPFPKSATGPSSSVSVLANASALKDAANAKFELKQFGDALSLYSKAIAVVRGQTNGLAVGSSSSDGDNSDAAGLSKVLASCFNNRAACFFMLRDYRKCAEDSEQAVEIDPKYVKAHTRRARALVELGDFRLAAHHLAQAHQLQPSRELLEEHQRVEVLKRDFEDGVALVGKGDFGAARAVLGALLQRTNAVTVVLWTARAELGTGLVDRALRLTLQVKNVEDYESLKLKGFR
jgi:tetratricopeptide (TPR) repeat protein